MHQRGPQLRCYAKNRAYVTQIHSKLTILNFKISWGVMKHCTGDDSVSFFRLASHPIGYPDNSLRGGSRLSPVLSITPITPRIHPMCLNVISPGSRATVCDTVRIHTLPSDLVRLGSSNPKNRFPPFHCHLPSYSASKPRSSRVSSLLLKTFMIKKKWQTRLALTSLFETLYIPFLIQRPSSFDIQLLTK